MSLAKKQEEKNLATIRKMLQLPENKKCFDCTEKGPTYVNLTHSTFICTTCAGIHREFSSRVKSISMATFTEEEMEKIKKGGNERGRKIWLAAYKPTDFIEPNSSEKERVREFMKLKYKEKVWYRDPRDVDEEDRKAKERGAPEAAPISQLLGNDVPKLVVNHSAHTAAPAAAPSKQAAASADPFGLDFLGSSAPVASQPAPSGGDFNPFGDAPAQPVSNHNAGDWFSAPAAAPVSHAPVASAHSAPAAAQNDFFSAFGAPATSQPAAPTPAAPTSSGISGLDFFSNPTPAPVQTQQPIANTSQPIAPKPNPMASIQAVMQTAYSSNPGGSNYNALSQSGLGGNQMGGMSGFPGMNQPQQQMGGFPGMNQSQQQAPSNADPFGLSLPTHAPAPAATQQPAKPDVFAGLMSYKAAPSHAPAQHAPKPPAAAPPADFNPFD
eukprot:TRINITY_DN259_c0_g1_i2.p1 TRINITY_DN259_c0_g1~~TRINITY_DN259_c0_g1_i2.p1  ORF type:complete len:439 (-),score=108.32 TRINITY_DN259_c0_g1_i2:124-1440(-)